MTTHETNASEAEDPAAGRSTESEADRGAAPGAADYLFAMARGAWPDPATHRKHALRSLGLTERGVEELLRSARVSHPFDAALIRTLRQRPDTEHNYPLQLLLVLLKEAEAAARAPWRR